MTWPRSLWRNQEDIKVFRSWMMLLLLLPLAAAGCRREEPITHYSARRIDDPHVRKGKPAALPPAKLEPGRFLGAMFPHLDQMWFVRLHGPTEKIAALEKDFEAFIRSFKLLSGARPIEWTLPPNWEERPAGGIRYATLRVPGNQEVIVTPLDRKSNEGKVLENINRFREDINVPPLAAGEEKTVTRELEVGGKKFILVDMMGMVGGAPKAKMPSDHPPITRKAPTNPFKVDLPKGWNLVGEEEGQYMAKAQEAIVTFEKQRRPDMDWPELLKDWRDVLAESGLSMKKLRTDRTSVQVDGAKLSAIELKLPDKKAIFGVQVPVGKESWTFFLIGTAGGVAEQEPTLLAFLRSLRSEPPKGETP